MTDTILHELEAIQGGPYALESLQSGGDGRFRVGADGVTAILCPHDRRVEFICFSDKVLVYVASAMGYPALYPLESSRIEQPIRAVLMDLDGTSVHSEDFWIWIVAQTTARLLNDPEFELEPADLPFVSGHSVSEHLQHCIDKYCPGEKVERARSLYTEIVRQEMQAILDGTNARHSFRPAPGLHDFLTQLKHKQIKIGLVTSGLYEKAWPEIVSAFRAMSLGDPRDFYDAIITAGYPLHGREPGTLGELEPKPHPWLYAETARIGLGIERDDRHHIVGIEDSAAGVIALRLAGFAAIGIAGGNIEQSGVRGLCSHYYDSLADALPLLLG